MRGDVEAGADDEQHRIHVPQGLVDQRQRKPVEHHRCRGDAQQVDNPSLS